MTLSFPTRRASVLVGTDWTGTRDRSWGIRPVGASEPQPPPEGNFNQFFWLWAPCNFADHSLFFHSNDDGEGHAWNRRAVIVGDGGAEQHFDAATLDRKSTRLNSSH